MAADRFSERLSPDDEHAELPLDPDTPPLPLHLRPMALVWVFVGGMVGTGLRYGLEELWPTPDGTWPWATFAVNLTGAFLLGALLESLALSGTDDGWRQRIRLLAGTGMCGAFTTYSTFALEVSLLGRADAIGLGIAYALVTVVGGLIAAWLGIAVAGRALRRVGEVA
ncbi:fluoride efflux transporter CrcB [Gordonia rhizosphera]|uniref:Fluoride-specific ion channel FluC n=1 Tax=Gordonia rhizosphera NBRC 16068 TaxID=1108045 RepID=K6WGH5_9ACTN|nr:fluoride efflux transporter CrcB [Gordonia rhizosphera]GAB91267.1 protein CrcB homolog [Gordonia rhizosphera NBRC 16068]